MLRQITAGVLVHESECVQSNSVIVEGRDGALLIDPGLTRDEMASIAAALSERGLPVVAGFSTHPDWDHVLWHPEFGDVPRWGTARGAASIADLLTEPGWQDKVVEGLPPEIAGEVPIELFGLIEGLPPGATLVPWDGPNVRIIEHRAHAEGHAALLIEEARVLVAGDMLSDVLVPMIDVDAAEPLTDYLTALDLLESAADRTEFVVPGHGSVGDAAELRARIALDREYVVALREGRVPDDPRIGPSAKDGWDWVAGIYEWQAQALGRA